MRLLCAAALLLTVAACRQTRPDGPPYSPERALESFALADGFQIELVAAEPLVTDPVAIDIDEYGRIWVAEMPGYPLDTGGSGRIKLLKDSSGDGKPDTAVLFADGLRLPTGLMRWKNGVIVTDPPDVLYLADLDGDGRMDERSIILTGFALSNPQHNSNSPIYGLDNWIYVANNSAIWWTEKYADPFGDRGGEVYFPANPDGARLPRNAADSNVRFRPDTFRLESLSGRSQFGHTFDPWGRHFLVDNSHHHYFEVIAAHYFGNNPRVSDAQAIHRTPDHGDAAEVFAVTINPEHQLLTDRGVFTSACGLTWYSGGLFPAPYDTDVTFVAEPVHNLVHVDKVAPAGPVFTAKRILDGQEFLASSDSWFRPVNFTVGPDGALYIVDYYRQIVEHPEWMDDSLAAYGDLTQGTDKGRLYRVAPDNAVELDWHDRITLGDATVLELVEQLTSPNAWWRRHAQRLLVDRQSPEADSELREVATSTVSPEGRLHALWTLEGLGRLAPDLVTNSLRDPHPGVRENAVRLAELHLDKSPALAQSLLELIDDPSARVRFQLLNTLGLVSSPAAEKAKEALLWRDIEEEWVQLAALLALNSMPDVILDNALLRSELPYEYASKFVMRLAALIAEAEGLPPDLTDQGPHLAGRLQGAAVGLRRHGERVRPGPSTIAQILSLAMEGPDNTARAALALLYEIELPVLDIESDALAVVRDSTRSGAARVRAVELLGLSGSSSDVFFALIDTVQHADVQIAAVRALGTRPGTGAAVALLDRWSSLTPAIREAVVTSFASQEHAELLVEALESNVVLPTEIPWAQRVRLMKITDEAVRSRARALLRIPAANEIDHEELVGAVGDSERGTEIFLTHCGQCHKAGEVGNATFGPDLATVRHWPRQALLEKIRNPQGSVVDGYEQWHVTLADGTRLQGIIADETPNSFTLHTLVETHVVNRDDVAALSALPGSAMPSDLDAAMSRRELLDLLSFLRLESSPR